MATTIKPVAGNAAGPASSITLRALSSAEVLTALRNGSGNLELIDWHIQGTQITRTSDSGQQAGTVGEVALLVMGRRAITAVQSGSGALLLISWDVSLPASVITRLHDSGTQAGAASHLAIAPISGSIFVTALRAGDGHLLLITWTLNPDGSFSRLADSGTQAGTVSFVAITSQADAVTGSTTVVTAVRNGSGVLELISWNVAAAGKRITRQADSGNQAGVVSEIAIVRGGPGVITAVKNGSGKLQVITWQLSPAIQRIGSIEAGSAAHIGITGTSVGPFIASMRKGTGDLELIAFNVAANGAFTRTGDYGVTQNFDVTETSVLNFGYGVLTATRKANYLNMILWEVTNS